MLMTARGGRLAVGLLGLGLALLGIGCGGGEETQVAARFQDTGEELLGDPTAVLARVDTVAVTLAEVDVICEFWSANRMPPTAGVRSRRELQVKALNHLVDQLLLSNEAQQRALSVPDSTLEQTVQRWEQQFPSPAARDEILVERNLTIAQVRDKFRRDLLVQQLVATTVEETLQVAEAEVQGYYAEHPEPFETTEVKARHILLKSVPGAPAESLAVLRRRAEGLRARVLAGEDFAAVAREASDCPSAQQGGDLGYFRRVRMVKPFGDAAFALQIGEISEVVETEFGFHVILVEDRRNEGQRPLAEVGEQIRGYLHQQRLQEAVDVWADELRAGAALDWFVES